MTSHQELKNDDDDIPIELMVQHKNPPPPHHHQLQNHPNIELTQTHSFSYENAIELSSGFFRLQLWVGQYCEKVFGPNVKM